MVCRDPVSNARVSEFSVPVGSDFRNGEIVLDLEFNLLVARGGGVFAYHGGSAADRGAFPVTVGSSAGPSWRTVSGGSVCV